MSALFELDYGVTDRLSATFGVPYVWAKYTGALPAPSNLPVDNCQCWHSSLQDFSVAARYRFGDERWAVTPLVRYVQPSHDYRFKGEAVVGRNLREVQLGFAVGTRLAFLPRASVHGPTPTRWSRRSWTSHSTDTTLTSIWVTPSLAGSISAGPASGIGRMAESGPVPSRGTPSRFRVSYSTRPLVWRNAIGSCASTTGRSEAGSPIPSDRSTCSHRSPGWSREPTPTGASPTQSARAGTSACRTDRASRRDQPVTAHRVSLTERVHWGCPLNAAADRSGRCPSFRGSGRKGSSCRREIRRSSSSELAGLDSSAGAAVRL